jgi:hypothetical protein
VEAHRSVEGVATNNLVRVCRRRHAGVDNGIEALDDELGAGKSQQSTNVDVLRGGIVKDDRRRGQVGELQLHDGDEIPTFRALE